MKRYGKYMERSGCRMQVHINECVKKSYIESEQKHYKH